MFMKFFCGLFAILLSANNVSAQEIIVGLGVDYFDSGDDSIAASISLEYRAAPFSTNGKFTYSWETAFAIDENTDFFLGAGIHAMWRLGNPSWFIEGSFKPGYYGQDDSGNDLGGNLQFRTLFGLGYELNSRTKISVAVDHKSNGSIEDTNPGEETFALRYGILF